MARDDRKVRQARGPGHRIDRLEFVVDHIERHVVIRQPPGKGLGQRLVVGQCGFQRLASDIGAAIRIGGHEPVDRRVDQQRDMAVSGPGNVHRSIEPGGHPGIAACLYEDRAHLMFSLRFG